MRKALLILAVNIILYLSGAVIEVNLNIFEWKEGLRALIIVIMLTSTSTLLLEKQENQEK